MENEDGEEVMVEDRFVEAVETPMTYEELKENHPKILEKMEKMELIEIQNMLVQFFQIKN